MADKKKIIVIGGGFGGVFAAKSLEKLGRGMVDVELINNNNYFVFSASPAGGGLFELELLGRGGAAPAAAQSGPGSPSPRDGHRFRP